MEREQRARRFGRERSRQARRIERRVLGFVREGELVAGHEHVLLAVSGGPDSLALLLIFSQVREQLGVRCSVAYIDHGLRPAAAIAGEREVVAAVAADFAMPSLSAAVDVAGEGRGRSPEEAARQARYAALARLAADAGATAVATGHTASDQAETVLLRIIRGTGVRGLAGMTPAAPWPVPGTRRPALLRPLLCLSRAETEAYCGYWDELIEPVADTENANRRYLRNRIRHEILPQLRDLNPRIEAALLRLAAQAGEWRRAQAEAEVAAGRTVQVDDDGVRVRLAALEAVDQPGRIAILRRAWQAALPDRAGPSRAHLEAMQRLALGGAGDVALPGGLVARRNGDWLLLGEAAVPHGAEPPRDQPLAVPGVTVWAGWRIEAAPAGDADFAPERAPGEVWDALVDAAYAAGLTVGPRRPGDRIELAGMTGRKRLQDLFVDAKTPREQRHAWPVIRTPRGVLWVAGFRPAAWARGEGPALRLTVRRYGQA